MKAEHSNSEDFEDDVPSVTTAISFKCNECDVVQNTEKDLETHVALMHKTKNKIVVKRFPCDDCEVSFVKKKDLLTHMLADHPKSEELENDSPSLTLSFKCNECVVVLQTAKDLDTHTALNHKKSARPAKNSVLNERSINSSDLSRTDLSSSGFSTSMKANTTSRNISVVGESFVCECGKSSSTKSGAACHKCMKEKQLLKCSFCEKLCGNAGSLKQHINSKHKENSQIGSLDEGQATDKTKHPIPSDVIEVVQNKNVEHPQRNAERFDKNNSDENPDKSAPVIRRSSRRKSITSHKKKASAKK